MYTCSPVLHKAHLPPHNMQKAMEVEEYEIYMYAFKSMVHGYHVYQEMWVADVGEELSCVKETENHQDPFSVAAVSTVADNKKLTFRTVATIVVRYVHIRIITVLFSRAHRFTKHAHAV